LRQTANKKSINQSINTHLYSTPYVASELEVHKYYIKVFTSKTAENKIFTFNK